MFNFLLHNKNKNRESLYKENILDFSIGNFIKKNWLVFLALTILVFISYANSLINNFVSDDLGIVRNANLFKNFTHPAFHSFFDFSRAFTYYIILNLWGLNPFYFRLISLLFHLGVTYLLFIIISLFYKNKIGLLSASIFAVHPILSETVVWISAGIYLQYSFFFLLSFLIYLLSSKNKKLYIFSVITFFFSIFASERAAALSLIFPLFELCFGDIKRNWKKIIPYFVLGVVFLLFSLIHVQERVLDLQNNYFQGKVVMNPLIQIPVAITSYFELIFWPQNLTLYHSELNSTQFNFIARLIVFIIFLGLIFVSYKKEKIFFFWSCFFIISLLPTLTPFGISWIVAERYVYLGSVGIFVLFSFLLIKLLKVKEAKMIIYSIFSIILIILSVRTILRNVDWQNEDNLWISTAKTSPSSPNTHNNMGDVYARHRDLPNAAIEFQRAIKIKPNYPEAYHNLANILEQMGDIDKAIENYKKAIELNPNLWQSYENLAGVYLSKNEYKQASQVLEKAISINSSNINLILDLGIVNLKSGNKDKAKELFLEVLKTDPNNQKAKMGIEELRK